MKDTIKNSNNNVIQNSVFEFAPDEQKVRALNIIIDRELEKPENEADMELINSCMDMIEKIHGGVRERSESELNEALGRITSSDRECRRSKLRFRRFAGVACAMLIIAVILGMTITVMARVSGYNSASEWLSDHMGEVLGWGPGAHEKEGITIYRGETSKDYGSIEELLSKEELDILYPSALPDGIKLRSVSITEFNNGEFTISFIFDTDSIGISISNFDLSSHIFNTDDKVTVNGVEFGISHISEWYQADCITGNYAYTITSYDYDSLIYLLNSMKKCEK